MDIDTTTATHSDRDTTAQDRPARAWLLAIAGGLIGLAVQGLANGKGLPLGEPLRITLAMFLAITGIVVALIVERAGTARALGFAVATGGVFALITWWNIPRGTGSWLFPWQMVCAVAATGIAVPMWQSWQSQGSPRMPYPLLHRHAWTTALLGCAVCVFVVVVWALAFLLAELFGLIGLTVFRTLLTRDWAIYLLFGATLGGGIGVLRDRSAMIAAGRRAVAAVLTVLAPVLAVGLALFLAAIPFTGLAPLWEATRSTTPVLLCCILGALLLIDAAIGDTPESEARHPVFRASVIGLAAAMLPLAAIAAVSTGLRIRQHGMTPDRLWALTFVVIACAYGVAYAVALIRRRGAAAQDIRHANLRLGIGIAVVAIVLATPIVPFGRIAARDQVARLERGAVSSDTFDWRALRFEFGPAGVEALRRLAREGRTAQIRTAAASALRQQDSWPLPTTPPAVTADRLTVLPRGSTLPPTLRAQLPDYSACFSYDSCAVLMQPGGGEAVIVNGARVNVWRRMPSGAWAKVDRPNNAGSPVAKAALKRGEIEVRTVMRRQVFVAGRPVDAPFE